MPLDPALSVTGAAKAYRILYSTLDQRDSPAVYPDEDHTGTVLASMVDSTPFLARVFGPH